MMNIGARDAAEMSFWEYEARLYHWNKIHSRESSTEPKVPHEITEAKIAALMARPELLTGKLPNADRTERARMI
jgi:hypothetical protein